MKHIGVKNADPALDKIIKCFDLSTMAKIAGISLEEMRAVDGICKLIRERRKPHGDRGYAKKGYSQETE